MQINEKGTYTSAADTIIKNFYKEIEDYLLLQFPQYFAKVKGKHASESAKKTIYIRIKVVNQDTLPELNKQFFIELFKGSKYEVVGALDKHSTDASKKFYTYSIPIKNKARRSSLLEEPVRIVNFVFTEYKPGLLKATSSEKVNSYLTIKDLNVSTDKFYTSDELLEELLTTIAKSNKISRNLKFILYQIITTYTKPIKSKTINIYSVFKKALTDDDEVNYKEIIEEFERESVYIGKNFGEILSAFIVLNLNSSLLEDLNLESKPKYVKFSKGNEALVDSHYFDDHEGEVLEIEQKKPITQLSTKYKKGAAFSITSIFNELDAFIPENDTEQEVKNFLLALANKNNKIGFTYLAQLEKLANSDIVSIPALTKAFNNINDLVTHNKQTIINDFVKNSGTKNKVDSYRTFKQQFGNKKSLFPGKEEGMLIPATECVDFVNYLKYVVDASGLYVTSFEKLLDSFGISGVTYETLEKIYKSSFNSNQEWKWGLILGAFHSILKINSSLFEAVIAKALSGKNVHQLNIDINDKGDISFKISKLDELSYQLHWKGYALAPTSNNLNIFAK